MFIDKMKRLKKIMESNSGVMVTTIVGLATAFISWKANSIYELQAIIAKNSELPNFQVEMERVYEDNYQTNYSIIRILNLGGKFHNYKAEVITFMECDVYNDLDNSYYEIMIPVSDYYSDWYSFSYTEEGSNVIQGFDNKFKTVIIDRLNDEVQLYNERKEDGELYFYLESYIKISYINLLGEQEVEYYFIDFLNQLTLVEKAMGENAFKIYEEEKSKGNIIDIPINGDIRVSQLLECLNKISLENNIDFQLKEGEKKDMERIILGIIIGVGIAGGLEFVRDNIRRRLELKRYVALVYYDLKNVENYLKEEKDNVNLLYTDDWKEMLAECTLLKSDDIAYLYDLYNMVYNYNVVYKQKIENAGSVQKKDISYYDELKIKVFLGDEKYIDTSRYNVKYENVIKKLEKKISLHNS